MDILISIISWRPKTLFILSFITFLLSFVINIGQNPNPHDLLAPLGPLLTQGISTGMRYVSFFFLILGIIKFAYEALSTSNNYN